MKVGILHSMGMIDSMSWTELNGVKIVVVLVVAW